MEGSITVGRLKELCENHSDSDEVIIDGNVIVAYCTGSLMVRSHEGMDSLCGKISDEFPDIKNMLKELHERMESMKKDASKNRGELGFNIYSDLTGISIKIAQLIQELTICEREAHKFNELKDNLDAVGALDNN